MLRRSGAAVAKTPKRGVRISRRRGRRGSSRAGPVRPPSVPESRRIRGHVCAWDTCCSRPRCSIGSIKIFRTRRPEAVMQCRPNAVRPSCGSLQTHGPGRSPRLPDPSVPKPSRSSLNSNPAPAREKTRAALHSQKNSGDAGDNGGGVSFWRNSLCRTGTERGGARAIALRRSAEMPNVLFTIPARTLWTPHFRRVRVALSLPSLRRWWAASELEVRKALPVGKRVGSASGGMVFGANGDPTVRFGGAGRA